MQNGLNVRKLNASLQKLAFSFHSENDYLDRFLRENIALDDGYGKTYVFLTDDNNRIIGYYNLGVGDLDQIEYGSRKKMGGAVHINCFALDKNYHGAVFTVTDNGMRINLSDALLDECLRRIEEIRKEDIGFAFVTLNSTKKGFNLYKRNGFELLEEDMVFSVEETDIDCTSMYLIMDEE